ncbi:MAG: DNA/RNA helicase domain-containing protein [Planctomycetota bacterium]
MYLVGGGQEIHDGEAGIDAWIAAARDRYPHWHVYLSPRLTDSEYGAGTVVESVRGRQHVHLNEDLHLSVSMRSFRAEHVSGFIKAVLDCDLESARRLYCELRPRYPLVLTRDLPRAKEWVRQQARGSERYGLVASSQAERLKPHAIDVRAPVNPVHWFLNEREDTRSSFYLEDAATEFQVQGLELDWACVTWDADLRMGDGSWAHRKFHGSRWKHVRQQEHQRYLVNAYRVLLTRARQGMVVCVPRGDERDPTRKPAFYDRTFDYLASLGIEQI